MTFIEDADTLLDCIWEILAGENPELQGAVVNDLAAIWIAGHRVPGDRADGDQMRAELLALHAQHVGELVAMYLDGVDG